MTSACTAAGDDPHVHRVNQQIAADVAGQVELTVYLEVVALLLSERGEFHKAAVSALGAPARVYQRAFLEIGGPFERVYNHRAAVADAFTPGCFRDAAGGQCGLLGADETDGAALATFHRCGADKPFLVHSLTVNAYRAAPGQELSGVDRLTLRGLNFDGHVPVRVLSEVDARARSKNDRTIRSGDDTCVLDARGYKEHISAGCGRNLAKVLDRPGAVGSLECIGTFNERIVGKVKGRGYEATDIDPGPLAEENAIAVQQQDAPIGRETAHDAGRHRTQDTVKCG